jgi:amidase
MTPEEYASYDSLGLAKLVQQKEIHPRELVTLALGQIDALDPKIGAIVDLDREAAYKQAEQVRLDAPLAGVPFLIKDTNIDAAGFATRHASKYFADASPATEDSEIVKRWRAAGLIIIGKTKTPEYAAEFTCEPRWQGPTRNPWNTDHSTGGSSGGAGAAVAAGMVSAAHGTDCGGSIRVPAAACGLVGLKPTRGRNPVGPGAGELVCGLDVEHVLVRSVRDTAAFLDTSSAWDNGAPYQAPVGPASFLASLSAQVEPMRIGLITTRPDGREAVPEIAAATKRTAETLASIGHTIVAFEWPDLDGADEAAALFWHIELAWMIETRKQIIGRDPAPDELEPVSWVALRRARSLTALDYMRARASQNQVSRAMAAKFAEMDALLLPTTATLPPLIGQHPGPHGQEIDGYYDHNAWLNAGYDYCPFTEIFNLTGQPALSMPAGLSTSGLPIGIQLATRFGDEASLLGLAHQLETADPALTALSLPHRTRL